MKYTMSKHIAGKLALLFVLAILLPASASATGPRVTKALFAIDKAEIHTLDFPPFLSTELPEGGPYYEIVSKALEKAQIDAVISIHPLQRMVRYYLLQENALAVMGRHMSFSSEEKQGLIFIPIAVLTEKYYYYKPSFPQGLNWDGTLASLKGKTYGAHKGEDVSAYKAAGIDVKSDKPFSLLKMLASKDADFAAFPLLNAEWLLNKFLQAEKANFAATDQAAGEAVFYMIFNKQHPQGEASAAAFKTALRAMVNDGRYAQIMEKHLGNGETLKLYMGNVKERLAQ